jgi:hypothetical protein
LIATAWLGPGPTFLTILSEFSWRALWLEGGFVYALTLASHVV